MVDGDMNRPELVQTNMNRFVIISLNALWPVHIPVNHKKYRKQCYNEAVYVGFKPSTTGLDTNKFNENHKETINLEESR